MKTLTITSDDEKALQQVKELAESLHIHVKESGATIVEGKTNGQKVAELLEQIAERGSAAKLIPDPVAWQKEQRKDRKLPFRD